MEYGKDFTVTPWLAGRTKAVKKVKKIMEVKQRINKALEGLLDLPADVQSIVFDDIVATIESRVALFKRLY